MRQGSAQLIDPLQFAARLWPNVTFTKEQKDVIYSVKENDETFVPAGNMVGKDFVAGFIVLWFFMSRHPCRIITTSAKDDHLRVLWGEIGRYVQSAKYALDYKHGGPLIINHQEIKKIYKGEKCPLSYTRGLVAASDSIAAMQGHHIAETGDGIPRTLFVADECSSVNNEYYVMASTWMRRFLGLGNPWPCENFFKWAVEGNPATNDAGGDIPRDSGVGYYRRVIQIKAESSPNVRYGLKQLENGITPTNEILVPGVKSYAEYAKNRKLWDRVQQCVCLDAEFYKGAGAYLFPIEWLEDATKRSMQSDNDLVMGIDSAAGGDNTCWCIGNKYGLKDLISKKTPDTSVITSETKALMYRYNIDPHNILFDAGGGGQMHADRLERDGVRGVRRIAFGEKATPAEIVRRMKSVGERMDERVTKYVYFNRRAELYGTASELLNPVNNSTFAIPKELLNRPREDRGPSLRHQLSKMPLRYDDEGRMYLPPKQKRPDLKTEKECLIDLIGCSPDEADAFVLMCFGAVNKSAKRVLGRAF